jgi:hypothetical protein
MLEAPDRLRMASTTREGPETIVESDVLRRERMRMPPRSRREVVEVVEVFGK